MTARQIGIAAFWLLLLLQPLWQLVISPAQVLPPVLVTTLLTLPLALPAIGLLLKRAQALFWGGLVSLLHFSHGITELWTDPGVTALASAQIALSTLLIGAIGWDGLQKRRAAKAAAAATAATEQD